MDSLVFRCPGCQQPFQVLAEQAGQMVRCPSCEDTVQIPAAAAPAAQPQDASSKGSSPNPNVAEVQANGAKTEAEQVQAYGCPKCEKPFWIFPSMFGSEMACPHCEKTVLLKPLGESSVKTQAKSKPTTKSKTITKPNAPAKKKTASAPVLSNSKAETKPAALGQKATQRQESGQPNVSAADDQRVPPDPNAPPISVVADAGALPTEAIDSQQVDDLIESGEAPVVAFVRQPVDHLLPPKFAAVDPAFFYRRHQDGAQVLLPSEDGSLKVVDNRIVRIEHNGQIYELISSPRYDRIQKSIVYNLLAVIICGLLIAIVMTLLNG